jgi:group I intron endonuclease
MKTPALNTRSNNPLLVKLKGVYKITCLENGRFYIGSSVSIQDRWREHITAMLQKLNPEAAKLSNKRLLADAYQYGLHSFTFQILELCPTLNREQLEEREYELINQLSPYYNIRYDY